MASLLALDLGLGPALETAVRRCVEDSQAFCVLDQRLSASRRRDELAALGATHVLDDAGRHRLDNGVEVADEVGVVMLTSGSSGPAKAALLSWEALRASATLTTRSLHRGRDSVWLPCLPANHIGGLAVLLRAAMADASLVWGDPHDLSSGPGLGATHVAVVRAQLRRFDLSGYDVVLLGGARPPGDLDANVVVTWGMTETGSGVVYDGRALPGVDLTTIDGQLCLRSPTLFTSYRHSPRPRVVGPDGSEEWFPTGDAADIVEGRLRVRGRLGYVINTGGEKVWPDDLESALMAVDGVRDVAVTSAEDEEWGERVVALVVSDGPRDEALRAAAAEGIGPWAKPRDIHYVDEIPRTPNGKIRRNELARVASDLAAG